MSAGIGYLAAMREVLAGGGDTDTNACIVGGLIGAADGVDAISPAVVKAVIECDTTKGRHPRPDFLSGRQTPSLTERLMAVDLE